MLQSHWQIRLLGGISVRQGANEIQRFSTKQTELLFAMLAEHIGRSQPRTQLTEALWPDVEPEIGRNRLRVALSYLRRITEPPGTPPGSVVRSDREAIGLSPHACSVDTDEFSRRIERANTAKDREEKMAGYADADALYGGEFLSGWHEEWVEARRVHYSRLQALAQGRYASLLEESGDREGALRQIFRSIEADPLREAPRRRAMRLLVEAGDIGAALEEFDRYGKVLKRSVGLVPTEELRGWVRSLRSKTTRPRSPKGESQDLDSRTEAVDAELDHLPSARVLVPPALTSFVGRSTEISDLSDMLLVHRWITLTGPGGIGKTRLAIETARANVSNFAAGVFIVFVGEQTSASTLLDTVLRQVGMEPSLEPLEALRRFFALGVESGRNAVLFVFDSFDQLPAQASELLTRLLSEFPNVTILVTSRKSLDTMGEREYPVGPLPVPDAETSAEAAAANPAVRLFLERAQSASPRFGLTRANAQTIVALCRRLEGVPLSIELAAARSRGSSAGVILEELGDLMALSDPDNWREPRHRSLSASLASSLTALPAEEQVIFCKLSVFPGSFDSAAADAVVGAKVKHLAVLAGHSLLVRQPEREGHRFGMLDMVREFGWSRLSPAERFMVQESHASYFRQLVAEQETLHLYSGVQTQWRLRLEAHNVRLAANWTLEHCDAETTSRLALGMVWLWSYVGAQQEGREYVRRALETTRCDGLPLARLTAAEGLLASYHEDAETACKYIAAALPGLEAGGLWRHANIARGSLGYAEYLRGGFAACLERIQEVQEACREEGMARWDAHQCHLLGITLCQLGRLDESRSWQAQAEQIWRDLGDVGFLGYAYLGYARLAWARGDLDEATQLYGETAAVYLESQDPRGIAYAVEGLGRVAVTAGRYRQATQLLAGAQRMRDSIGMGRDFVDARDFEVALATLRRELADAFETEWKQGYDSRRSDVRAWLSRLT